MKVKKILIVPASTIIEEKRWLPYTAIFFEAAKMVKRKVWKALSVYDVELQRYADMPKILGKDNVFVFGALYPHLYSEAAPKFCPYPSCHGTPKGRIVHEPEVRSIFKAVDAVLVSARAGQRGEFVIAEARKRDVPIAMLDAHDHLSNYGAVDIRQKLCRGFVKGKHYDLYFKNDLPLGYKTDVILPLAPCPLRPESYKFRVLPKDIDAFFSGKIKIKDQDDGRELIEFVKNRFRNVRILGHKGHASFLALPEYWDYLSRSRLALSPSRFVWDSFRHCEAGLAPGTALVAPKPYVETVGPPLKDGVNSILYDTELRGGKHHLYNESELLEKIKYYLANQQEREKIAHAWAKDVESGHTVYARSKYVLDSIERIF